MSSADPQKNSISDQKRSGATRFIDPEKIIDSLGIAEGSVVADFGCANGYFSLPIAQKIGEEGVVYCLDILPQCVEAVESQAKTKGITNIVAKRANIEKDGGSKLPDGTCDWVILKNVLFMNKEKETILEEAKRVLKETGKVLVIEWDAGNDSFGPDKKLRISKEALIGIIEKSGLVLAEKIAISDFHYGLVLAK